MKIQRLTVAALAFSAINLLAQTIGTSTGQTSAPAPTPYAITRQDANSRVWERTTYETSPDGKAIPHLHKYTEVATGLNHLVNGQWVASKEEIDINSDGTAAAINGQHQAYFPSDIYNGQIELVTPDGLQLKSQPVGLSYDDGTNTVLIAVLTNSVGQVVNTNQVIYPNAFTGFAADLLYTYRKDGFEQDIVLREQPPTPESLGLNAATTRLQVLTEFFNPANPMQTTSTVSRQDGLADTTLTFGQMKMVQGKAFAIGDSTAQTKRAPVYKSWQVLQGRTFLVEEVPVARLAAQLGQLPAPANATASAVKSLSYKVSATRSLPPVHLAQADTNTLQLARLDLNRKQGVVLDYVTLDPSISDFTFQGDTTYYVSGWLDLYGTNIFEGGTVIKYTSSTGASLNFINFDGFFVINTSSYRPAVFTSMDDNTVGDTISGSTGSPTTIGSGVVYLYDNNEYSNETLLSGMRFSYAGTVYENDQSRSAFTFQDCQFVQCGTCVSISSASELSLYNDLITQCGLAIEAGLTLDGNNITVDNCASFDDGDYGGNNGGITNSIFTGGSVDTNEYAFDDSVVLATNTGVFQTVGGGSYYLATNSIYHNAGTTNLDPALLADLATKTTYPPIVYSNVTISVNTTLSPQAQRDNTGNPDLGYHYDPLDYVFGGVVLDTNLTFTTGTAVGWFETDGSVSLSGQPYGISLNSGANFTSTGTATAPCWIARTMTVQEGNGNWTAEGYLGGIIFDGSGSGGLPQLNGRFTKWSSMANDGNLFRDNWAYGTASFTDCEFYSGGINSYRPPLYFTNCLFFEEGIAFWDQENAASCAFENCTFWNGGLVLCRYSGQSASFWNIQNTAFDGTAFQTYDNYNGNTNYTLFNYNAYNTNNLNWQTFDVGLGVNTNTLETIGPNDVMVTNYNWQSSWFGNFYLPSDSPLIDMGSTNANFLGLYHFTTQTNQTIEGDSIVDIGYHYVATDQYGNPLDYNGDGIPDYIEDANGDGLDDSGEIGWNISGDLGLQVWITQPKQNSSLP